MRRFEAFKLVYLSYLSLLHALAPIRPVCLTLRLAHVPLDGKDSRIGQGLRLLLVTCT